MLTNKFEYWKAGKDDWRWQYKATSGLIICTSTQSYISKRGVVRAITTFTKHVAIMLMRGHQLEINQITRKEKTNHDESIHSS